MFPFTCPYSEFQVLTLAQVRQSAEFEEALSAFPGLDRVTDQEILQVIIGFTEKHNFTAAASRFFERDGDKLIATLVATHMHFLAAVLAEAQATVRTQCCMQVCNPIAVRTLYDHFLFIRSFLFTRLLLTVCLFPACSDDKIRDMLDSHRDNFSAMDGERTVVPDQ